MGINPGLGGSHLVVTALSRVHCLLKGGCEHVVECMYIVNFFRRTLKQMSIGLRIRMTLLFLMSGVFLPFACSLSMDQVSFFISVAGELRAQTVVHP